MNEACEARKASEPLFYNIRVASGPLPPRRTLGLANLGAFSEPGGLLISPCLRTRAAAYALVQVKAKRAHVAGVSCAGRSVDALLWPPPSRQIRVGTIQRRGQRRRNGFRISSARRHRKCRRSLRHMRDHQPRQQAGGTDFAGIRAAYSKFKQIAAVAGGGCASLI
jgi:hypothetical protein